jgi:hypothetical protein
MSKTALNRYEFIEDKLSVTKQIGEKELFTSARKSYTMRKIGFCVQFSLQRKPLIQ